MKNTFGMGEIMMVAGTRMALGVGVGLLASQKLSPDARRGAGIALLVVGALTTIPLAIQIFGGRCAKAPQSGEGRTPQPIAA